MTYTKYTIDEERLPSLIECADIGCLFDVQVGTTGFCGGDSGHGGRSFLRFKVEAGDMSVSVDGKDFIQTDEVVIAFGGDWELSGLINACKFAEVGLRAIAHADD